MSDLLVNTLLATFLSIAVACFVLCFIGMLYAARGFARADRADAQADLTPLDEWAATAALDPRDGAGLACREFDPPPWMAERLIEETETYLQEHAK